MNNLLQSHTSMANHVLIAIALISLCTALPLSAADASQSSADDGSVAGDCAELDTTTSPPSVSVYPAYCVFELP